MISFLFYVSMRRKRKILCTEELDIVNQLSALYRWLQKLRTPYELYFQKLKIININILTVESL